MISFFINNSIDLIHDNYVSRRSTSTCHTFSHIRSIHRSSFSEFSVMTTNMTELLHRPVAMDIQMTEGMTRNGMKNAIEWQTACHHTEIFNWRSIFFFNSAWIPYSPIRPKDRRAATPAPSIGDYAYSERYE